MSLPQEQLLARDILALPQPGTSGGKLVFVGILGTPEQCQVAHVKLADALIGCAGDNAYVPFETDAFVLSAADGGETQCCYQGKTCQRDGCGLQFCPAAGIMASGWPPPAARGGENGETAAGAPRVVHVIPSSSSSSSFVPRIVEYLRRVRWPSATFVIEIRGARGIHATLEPASPPATADATATRAIFLRKNAATLFKHLVNISPSYLLGRGGGRNDAGEGDNCISSPLVPCSVFTDCLVRDDVLRDLAVLMTFAPSLSLCDAVRAFFCPPPLLPPPISEPCSSSGSGSGSGSSSGTPGEKDKTPLTALEQSIWETAVEEGGEGTGTVPLDPDTEEFLAELSSFVPPPPPPLPPQPSGNPLPSLPVGAAVPPPPSPSPSPSPPSSKFVSDAPSVLLCGPPGGGKCLHPDTPVRAADGSVLLARDVTVGTWLAGPRKVPRRVAAVLPAGRETGQLWVVHRTSVLNGGPYVTNSDHILVLRDVGSSGSGSSLVKIRAAHFAALPPAVAARYRDVASRFVLPGAPSPAEISAVLAGAVSAAVDAGRVRWETAYLSLSASSSHVNGREEEEEEESLFYFWQDGSPSSSSSPFPPPATLVDYARSIGLRAALAANTTRDRGEGKGGEGKGNTADAAVILGSGEDLALHTFLRVFLPSDTAARAVAWSPASATRRSAGSPVFVVPADPAIYGRTYAGFELDGEDDGTFLLADGTVTHNTSLVRRFAADAGLPLLTVTPATIFAKYVGESESRAAAVMSLALRRAPVVLFFDEIDGLLGSRYGSGSGPGGDTGSGNGAGDPISRNVKNLILAGWDAINRQGGRGDDDKRRRVYLFGATNHPERIDPAVLDRFAERVRVGLPGPVARKNLFAAFLDDEPCCAGASVPVDSEALAAAAAGLSAREIRAICARAVRSFFAAASSSSYSSSNKEKKGDRKRKRQVQGGRPLLSPFLTTADVLAAFASSSSAAAGERSTRAIGGGEDEGKGGRDTAAATASLLSMYC